MNEATRDRLRLWLKVLKASRSIEDTLRRRFREDFGTTLPRFDVMAALAQVDDGLKMSEIGTRLRVSNGNVTGIVDRLAEEGLVERVAVPGDRRASRVRLTAKGRLAFVAQAEAHAQWIDQLLVDFRPAEARALAGRFDVLSMQMEEETAP